MSESPTTRTTRVLRKAEITYEIVERWNVHARKTQDLYGFIDILAMGKDLGICGIQTTTMAHRSDRRAKIMRSPNAHTFLRSGGKVELWGWRKLQGRWMVDIEHFSPRAEGLIVVVGPATSGVYRL